MRGHVTPAVDHVTSPGLAREASSPATYASDFEDEPADPTLRSRSTSQTQQHAADPAAHAAAPQAGTPQHAGTSTVADSAAGHSRGQQGGDARQRAGSAGGDGEGGASRRSSATQLPQGTPPPAAATSAAMEGPVKAFSFSLDIRSFHASQHVPMETCNVFVRATLPKELRGRCSREVIPVAYAATNCACTSLLARKETVQWHASTLVSVCCPQYAASNAHNVVCTSAHCFPIAALH